jgi:mono/diheme cytochrome c family protein
MNPDQPNKPVKQNGAEPVAGRSTVPMWLIVVFGLLFYWGQLFLAENAGGFNKDVYGPYTSFDEVATANPQDPAAKQRAEGRRLFEGTCAACHLSSGLGAADKAPPLAGSEWVLAPSAERIARIDLNGLTGPISVKGQAWGLTMVPWKDNFTDDQIAAILTYIRTQSEWGNKAGPVDPQIVKAARAEVHPGPETADELMKIPVQ